MHVTENTGIDSGNGSGKQQKRTHKPRDAYWNNSGVTNNHGECEITPKNDSFRVSHKHPMAKSARFPRVFRVFRALFRNRGKRGKWHFSVLLRVLIPTFLFLSAGTWACGDFKI